MEDSNKRGVIYVLSNPAFVSRKGKKLLKIGQSANLLQRLGILNTGVPEDFKVEYALEAPSHLYKQVEKKLHTLFSKSQYNREFYLMTVTEIIDLLQFVNDIATDVKNVTAEYQDYNHKEKVADTLSKGLCVKPPMAHLLKAKVLLILL